MLQVFNDELTKFGGEGGTKAFKLSTMDRKVQYLQNQVYLEQTYISSTWNFSNIYFECYNFPYYFDIEIKLR